MIETPSFNKDSPKIRMFCLTPLLERTDNTAIRSFEENNATKDDDSIAEMSGQFGLI